MKHALFVCGGWDGHQPEKIVDLFAGELKSRGYAVQIDHELGRLADPAALRAYSLIFPCWTMGKLAPEESKGLQEAVRGGVNLGGIHGGMGDAFRGDLDYEWMTGGHFVGHPHVGDYVVRVTNPAHPITAGLPESFPYRSEQYYMMVDPGIQVLATTEYSYDGATCTMPVAWTKQWGKGRVFYSALGHAPSEFTEFPSALRLTVQGLLWAAGDL